MAINLRSLSPAVLTYFTVMEDEDGIRQALAKQPDPGELKQMSERSRKMRERAAEFAALAKTATDPVINAELDRLALLYDAQADRIERGDDPPSDPGETS